MRSIGINPVILAAALCGCSVPPTIEMRIANADDQPVAGVPVDFAGSGSVVLFASTVDGRYHESDRDSALGKPVTLRGPEISVMTNDDGRVSVRYWPPQRPGFWARLFGARTPREEIQIRYSLPSCVTVEQTHSTYDW